MSQSCLEGTRKTSINPQFQKLLDWLLEACQKLYGSRLVTAAVFGSVGRGVPRPDSDIDVLIVADPLPNGRIPRIEEFQAVEQMLRVHLSAAERNGIYTCLSPIFKTPAEVRRGSLLFLDMLDDVRILYDQSGFFARELEDLRLRLSRLGARRIWRGDAWYWDLKPDFQPGELFEI